MPLKVNETKEDIVFRVRVVPRASRSEIIGEFGGAVKVRICSPPVDGAANVEVVKLFAKAFGVAKSSVVIVSGETSRAKRIRITGVTAVELRNVLG